MFNFLAQKFSTIFGWVSGKGTLTEETISQACVQVSEALISADVPLATVEQFISEIKADILGKKVNNSISPGDFFTKTVYEKLVVFLGGKSALPPTTFQIPSVIMVMGLQGSGKTTTIAKIAHQLIQQAKQKNKQRHILLASIDFYRPAAIEQLSILSEKIGAHFYRAKNTTPLLAAKEIYDFFKDNSFELLFLDTAGRMHVDNTMMQELMDVCAKINPKHKLLVLDAMTGQESLHVAESFHKSVGFDAAILSKMDSETRAGAAFAFRYVLQKPIAWIGTGEKMDDLEAFIPDRIATRILGMGDIQSLVEKANLQINQNDQENLTKRILDGAFSLNDFYEQLGMVEKIGSLSSISRYLPGAHSITPEAMHKGQEEMKKFKAIISSMTMKERTVPQIIDSSRKKRIARGSGLKIEDINQLLQRFEQSKQFVKMFKKMGKSKRFF